MDMNKMLLAFWKSISLLNKCTLENVNSPKDLLFTGVNFVTTSCVLTSTWYGYLSLHQLQIEEEAKTKAIDDAIKELVTSIRDVKVKKADSSSRLLSTLRPILVQATTSNPHQGVEATFITYMCD
ncbi:hypothetical protein LIER_26608 [Lithospermum erythrorhizon]|uniref:Uncharacterized protein n=1 Tax=Lithospermum erythrorhizon TaxID=34254 RepID=A0AAV3RC65_LITER